MKRRVFAIFMAVVMVVGMTACGGGESAKTSAPKTDGASQSGGSDEVIHLRLGSAGAADFFPNIEIQTACDEVAEKTNGKLVIDFYPNNELGDYTDMFQELMYGSLDMGMFASPTSYDERLGIIYLPYLITDYDKFSLVCGVGGAIFDYYGGILEENNIRLLGMMTEGLHGIGMNKIDDISIVKDASAKKKDLIRTPPIDVSRYTAEALGYNAVQINFTDLYSSLQTGVCDGWIGGPAEVNYVSFRDVINYFIDGRYSAEIMGIMINTEVFDKLPEEYQKVLTEAFSAAGERSVIRCSEVEENARQKLRDYGIEVIEYTDEEREASAEIVRNEVYPKLADIYGEEAINNILSALEEN